MVLKNSKDELDEIAMLNSLQRGMVFIYQGDQTSTDLP